MRRFYAGKNTQTVYRWVSDYVQASNRLSEALAVLPLHHPDLEAIRQHKVSRKALGILSRVTKLLHHVVVVSVGSRCTSQLPPRYPRFWSGYSRRSIRTAYTSGSNRVMAILWRAKFPPVYSLENEYGTSSS